MNSMSSQVALWTRLGNHLSSLSYMPGIVHSVSRGDGLFRTGRSPVSVPAPSLAQTSRVRVVDFILRAVVAASFHSFEDHNSFCGVFRGRFAGDCSCLVTSANASTNGVRIRCFKRAGAGWAPRSETVQRPNSRHPTSMFPLPN